MAKLKSGDRVIVIKDGEGSSVKYTKGMLGTFRPPGLPPQHNVLFDNGTSSYLYSNPESLLPLEMKLYTGEEVPKAAAKKEDTGTGWGF